MTTAVDSSVVLAILKQQADGPAWLERLVEIRGGGRLVVCDVVWAETAVAFVKAGDHATAMAALGLEFSALTEESAARAGQMCLAYRSAGGKRERIIGDFMIGAHAIVQAQQLLTADQGFFRKHFRGLAVVGLG